jgi:hypothetical protein
LAVQRAPPDGHMTASRAHKRIRSWLDLARLAEELAGGDWIFRGESSDSTLCDRVPAGSVMTAPVASLPSEHDAVLRAHGAVDLKQRNPESLAMAELRPNLCLMR